MKIRKTPLALLLCLCLLPGLATAQTAQEGTLSLPGADVDDQQPGAVLTPVSPGDMPPPAAPPADTQPATALPAEPAVTPPLSSQPTADGVPTGQPENETPEQRAKRLVDRVTLIPEEKKQEASQLGYQPSYGTWPFSIMFTDKEMSDIKKVLDYYEIQKYQTEQSIGEEEKQAQQQVEDILLQQGEKKELVYPVFQLRSIVYKSAKHWTVTVNHQQYSSWDKPEKTDADELKVLALTPEKVTFSWVPKDLALYNGLLQKQLSRNIPKAPLAVTPAVTPAVTAPGASPDAAAATVTPAIVTPAPVAAPTTPAEPAGQYDNRKAAGSPEPALVNKTRALEFVLRPNQTIVISENVVYEGRPPNVIIAGDDKLLPKTDAAATAPMAADLLQQLDTTQPPGTPGTNPPAGTPPAGTAPDKTATDPAAPPAGGTEAAPQKDADAVTSGKSNPKAMIEKALGQGGF